MCKFKALGISWPPQGWDQLEHIKNSNGQSLSKDPASAMVTGLSYNIEPIPVYQKNRAANADPTFVYAVQIDGWEYNIHNESREYPVLSFMLQARTDPSCPKESYLSNIKTQARPLHLTSRSARRAMIAALFIMKQINSGQVPDAERILRLYKIHPTQRSLYEIDNRPAKVRSIFSKAHNVQACAPFICIDSRIGKVV